MEGGLSDTLLKGIHPRTIPVRLGLIWFRDFRGKDLNVIFYQNMPLQLQYMAMSSLTYILDFSVKFFFQPIYTDYAK
jgi:hypothetical protein